MVSAQKAQKQRSKPRKGELFLSQQSMDWMKRLVGGEIMRVFAPMDQNFQDLRRFIQDLAVRHEVLALALERAGHVNQALLAESYSAFMAFRDELSHVMGLAGKERIEAVLAWNAREGVKQIRPVEADLHTILIDKASGLSAEERADYAGRLGFGAPFVAQLQKIFSPQEEEAAGAAELAPFVQTEHEAAPETEEARLSPSGLSV